MPSCQVCNLVCNWWTMISQLLMIITAVVTSIGIKRLILCSSCIKMIYKYYHKQSVSQTGQGGPFSFSIDMNLPAKSDGHIGGKTHAAFEANSNKKYNRLLVGGTYHFACTRRGKPHRNWAWNFRYGNAPLQELAAWVANLSMQMVQAKQSRKRKLSVYTKFRNGLVLFQLRLGPSTFCSVWLETFLSCLSKGCKKLDYFLFADGHSCGSQEIVKEAGLDTNYGKTTLRLETVEISWNLEQSVQHRV